MLSNSVWTAVACVRPIDILQDQRVLLQTHDYVVVHICCGKICELEFDKEKEL